MKDGKNLSASSMERMKGESEEMKKSQVVRRRAINLASCSRRSFNKKRKKAVVYKTRDLIAIKRTQASTGLKFHSEFLKPYGAVSRNDRYMEQWEGENEGPQVTSTAAESLMKTVVRVKLVTVTIHGVWCLVMDDCGTRACGRIRKIWWVG